MEASDPAVRSSGLLVPAQASKGRLSSTCLKNLRRALLVQSLPRSPGNELGRHPACALGTGSSSPQEGARAHSVPYGHSVPSQSQRTLTPDTAVAVKGTAPQRGGQPQGASAEREPHVLGGSPTPHWASGSLLQDADLTVHSQNDGQGRLWTRADVGHAITGSP